MKCMKRILLIDDDDLFQNMLKQTLERAGYDVITASNGRIGLQLYQSAHFDIVITDLIMPEVEGIEIITNLRDDYVGIKIIAISGGGRCNPSDYLQIAKKLGADKIFTKPVDRRELLAAVEELVV